jgi:hypothetical protein
MCGVDLGVDVEKFVLESTQTPRHQNIITSSQQIAVPQLVSRPVSFLDVGEIFTFTFALWFQHHPTARHCYKLPVQRVSVD